MSEKEIDSVIVFMDPSATIVLSNEESKFLLAKSVMSPLPVHVLGSDVQRSLSKSV